MVMMASKRITTPDLFSQVRAICAGGCVITADRYLADGSSGKVYGLQDWLDDAHYFTQSASASQVAFPTANAALGGAICASFMRGQIYTSTRAASAWNYLLSAHTAFLVFSWASLVGYEALFEAAGGQANSVSYYASNVPNLTNHIIRNSSATISVMTIPASGAGYVEGFNQKGGGSPEQSVILRPGGTAVTQATITGTLLGISGTAVIGNRTGGGVPFGGKLRAVVIAPKLLSSTEFTTVRSWIQQDTGIAA